MGNRRFSRKRLFETEKLGKPVDLEAGAGIKDAIVSATQHRNGAEIITEIALDLGTSKASILGGGGDNGVIGTLAAASNLTRLTEAKFGIVTEIRAIVMEAPAGGYTQVNIASNAAVLNQDADATTEQVADLATVGQDDLVDIDNASTLQTAGSEHYLYLTNAGGGDATEMSAGKLLIYIHGFEAPSDI